MKKKYKDWGLYDIEKQVNKDSFLPFLEWILKNNGVNKLLEILKASGFFISYNDKTIIGNKQKEKVDHFNLHSAALRRHK